MRRGIQTKYNMIRYYYTQLAMLSEQGGAFYKPLFFEFPEEPEAYNDQTSNVMLGNALKLSVPAKSDTDVADVYFPAGTWCDVFNKTQGTDGCKTYETGTKVSVRAWAWDFYLHLRAGHLVPMQDAKALNAMTTADL